MPIPDLAHIRRAMQDVRLESLTDGLREGAVWRGVAYKYVGRAGMSTSCLHVAALSPRRSSSDIYVTLANAPSVYQSLLAARRRPG
jgi:hypothetical protein